MSRDGHRVLSGTARDESGEPMRRSWVGFTTPDGTLRTHVASDGTFHLCDVPETAGTLEVRVRGGILEDWSRENVTAAASPVDVVLRAPARFIGRIEPAPRSRAVRLRQRYASGQDSVTTLSVRLAIGEDGSFAIPWSVGRPVLLAFETPDAAPLFLDEPALEAGQVLDLGVLRLLPGTTVAARILDDRGEGIADARVVLSPDVGEDRWTRTDAAGRFRFDRLADAPLQLYVSAEGFVTRDVSLGAPRELRDTTLDAAGYLEGVLLDALGQPVRGFDVDCYPSDDGSVLWGTTDSLGRFRIPLPPGRYDLRHGDYEGPSVEVRARATTRVEFRCKE
jgi:hypothetical protein